MFLFVSELHIWVDIQLATSICFVLFGGTDGGKKPTLLHTSNSQSKSVVEAAPHPNLAERSLLGDTKHVPNCALLVIWMHGENVTSDAQFVNFIILQMPGLSPAAKGSITGFVSFGNRYWLNWNLFQCKSWKSSRLPFWGGNHRVFRSDEDHKLVSPLNDSLTGSLTWLCKARPPGYQPFPSPSLGGGFKARRKGQTEILNMIPVHLHNFPHTPRQGRGSDQLLVRAGSLSSTPPQFLNKRAGRKHISHTASSSS